MSLVLSIHGSGEEGREAAIDEAADRLKLWHTHDPSSYWLKVVDTDTGTIAGAGLWRIYKENPFAEPGPPEVTWSLTTARAPITLRKCYSATLRRDTELFSSLTFVNLFVIFTRPEYRRKGIIGQQIMDRGLNKSDELGYDVFLDAMPYGRGEWVHLYRRESELPADG